MNSHWSRFLTYLVPASLLLGLVMFQLYRTETKADLVSHMADERGSAALQKGYIESVLDASVSDLLYLAGQVGIHGTTSSGGLDRSLHDALAAEFVVFSSAKAAYDQVRFIDTRGREVIRVNWNNGRPALVPESRLQNKADRYYFQDAILLGRNEIYVSPLDLNIEAGKIEIPYKAMLRLATPVFDHRNTKIGILVLNYLADSNLLKRLHRLHENPRKRNMLLNAEGYWLHYDVHPELEFGFMFEDRKHLSFRTRYPEEADHIWKGEFGQFISPAGLFTFETVRPLRSDWLTSANPSDPASRSNRVASAHEYTWKLVTFIAKEDLERFSGGLRKRFLLFFFILAIPLAAATWLLSRAQIEREKFQNRIHEMARHDPLTNLPNRYAVDELGDRAIRLARRQEKALAVLFVDLDGFKPINDSYGHAVGDRVLQAVAERLTHSVRSADLVSRFGGDEFLVILQSIEGHMVAGRVAEKIIAALDPPIHIDDRTFRVGASIGISLYPQHGAELAVLIQRADQAMYQSKKTGPNNYRFHTT